MNSDQSGNAITREDTTLWTCPYYQPLIISEDGRPDECPNCGAAGDELTEFTEDEIHYV